MEGEAPRWGVSTKYSSLRLLLLTFFLKPLLLSQNCLKWKKKELNISLLRFLKITSYGPMCGAGLRAGVYVPSLLPKFSSWFLDAW